MLYGPLLLLALYFQEVQHASVLATGLLLAPQGLGSLIPRTIVGRLVDRVGPRAIVVVGLLLTATGTLPFTQAGARSHGCLLSTALFVRGAGLAAATIAVMAGAFWDVARAEVPSASATARIVQQVGGSFGVAVLTVILSHQILVEGGVGPLARASAFGTAFTWATVFWLLPLVPAAFLQGAPTR